jgi:hypothetical protein
MDIQQGVAFLKTEKRTLPTDLLVKMSRVVRAKHCQMTVWHSTERKGGKCIKGVQQQVLQVQVATFYIKSRKNR